MKTLRLLNSVLIFCLAFSLIACGAKPPQKIDLTPCILGNNTQAQCGTLSVFENRATNQGRKIDIHVAVIKASGANPAPDPVFYFAGGPGASAIDDAAYAMLMLKTANQQRDLVLVDQRGTGRSNKMTCPRDAEESGGLVPVSDVMLHNLQTCLAGLNGDPAAYTTAWGMDDVDDVRAALGYDQINLYGESYGPLAEQVYLQRHGAHVRTATLEGVTMLDIPIFERYPRSSQEALDQLYARCKADAACNSAYPDLSTEVTAAIARIEEQPAELPVISPITHKPGLLTRDSLVIGIHNLLRDTDHAVLVPYVIHLIYKENWSELAKFLVAVYASSSTEAPTWSIMNLTILCGEDWARMDRAETAKYSAGSYMGYEDMRRLIVPENVCALMPHPRPEALYQPLTTSPVPVLLITNGADPQNPPENVETAKKHFPNSLDLIAPGQGHGYDDFECRDKIIGAFIQSGTTRGLDAKCLQRVPLPPFYLGE